MTTSIELAEILDVARAARLRDSMPPQPDTSDRGNLTAWCKSFADVVDGIIDLLQDDIRLIAQRQAEQPGPAPGPSSLMVADLAQIVSVVGQMQDTLAQVENAIKRDGTARR